MIADDVLEGRLAAFLATRGAARDRLVQAVDEPFGRPLLIVAAGSVLQGFGNSRSDVDLNVVVERKVTGLPMTSYEARALLDTVYFGASDVESWIASIRDREWPPRRLDRHDYDRRSDELFYSTRFGGGLLLRARDGWDRWMAEFRAPWLAVKVAQWWQVESLRRQLAARWLRDVKPLLAAQCQLEAVVAALESRVAAAGQIYFGSKWLSEKLRILADTQGLDALRAVMRMPTSIDQAHRFIEQCDPLLETFGGRADEGLAAQVWYASGVRVRELDTRTLVSRWDVRGIELPGPVPVMPEPAEPVWEGSLTTAPPANVLALFAADMTWLSIVAP